MSVLPNFLIVGAAKSGTTTLNYYLENHKDVLMAEPKEPKFFSYKYAQYNGFGDEAFTKKKTVKTLSDYKKSFSSDKKYKCVGEASVDTLFYHNLVIPDIKSILGDPKIIILLRNPVDRAISAYSHLVRDGREKLDFIDALGREEERLNNGFEFIWGYKKGGLYHDQVKSFLDNFSEVKILFFEDMINDNQETLDEVTTFLAISAIEMEQNLKLNVSGKSKNAFLNKLISRDTGIRRMMTAIVGKKNAIKIKNAVQRRNVEKIIIPDEVKKELALYFKDDILELQNLLGKDLSSWMMKYK